MWNRIHAAQRAEEHQNAENAIMGEASGVNTVATEGELNKDDEGGQPNASDDESMPVLTESEDERDEDMD
jgi:hypothetical protein